MILFPILLLAVLIAVRVWDGVLLAAYLRPPDILAFNRGLIVVIVVAAAILIDGLVRHFYWHRYWRRRRGRETPALIRDIMTVAILLLGLSFGLWWQEGLSFTGLITASGATAIILGIALQTVIQDLFSGLSVNLEGSYSIGDWLTIYSEHMPQPAYGRVSSITWRSTYLTQLDGRRLMVPNHLMTANAVLNHSRPHEPKRLNVEISVDVRLPCERVIDMFVGEAMKVVRQPGMAHTPPPYVLIERVASGAIVYQVYFYAEPERITPIKAHSLMYRALVNVLQQNKLPLPVMQVEMVEPPDLSNALGEQAVRDGLGHAELFHRVLDEAQLEFLAARSHPTGFSHHAVLMRQGEAATSMFIILEGAARVTIAHDGGEQEVAMLATGDVVGEMSLMTGAPRSATVTAQTQMRALEITKEAIAELLQNSPDLFQRFSLVLAKRQEQLDQLAHRHVSEAPNATALMARMRAFFSHVLG